MMEDENGLFVEGKISMTETGKKVANDKVSEYSDFIDTMIFLLDLKPKLS